MHSLFIEKKPTVQFPTLCSTLTVQNPMRGKKMSRQKRVHMDSYHWKYETFLCDSEDL